jgi:hypothetical protein
MRRPKVAVAPAERTPKPADSHANESTMHLSRIIYASSKSKEMSPEDLEQILTTAQDQNRRNGITGMLCFNRKYFLQILEGGRTALNETYNRIVSDPRHDRCILIEYARVDRRQFESWSMGYVPEAGLTEHLLMRYGGRPEFNPLELTPTAALSLMTELRDSLRVVRAQ